MTFPKQRKQVAENQSSLPIKPPFNEAGTIFEINAKFLHGFLCGAVAWWCWPSDPKWWGFYIYAVVLWAACAAFIIQCVHVYHTLSESNTSCHVWTSSTEHQQLRNSCSRTVRTSCNLRQQLQDGAYKM